MKTPSRLYKLYRDGFSPEWTKKHGYKSLLAAPRISKITLNMGVGETVSDKKILTAAMDDLKKISGQKPISTKARRSIAGFKIRKDYALGCKVTLRRRRMYDFLERLITVALPRARDFRGLSARSFDGRGNYSLGIAEQIVFPEIQYEKIDVIRGLDVTINTTAKTDDDARELLLALGLPLR